MQQKAANRPASRGVQNVVEQSTARGYNKVVNPGIWQQACSLLYLPDETGSCAFAVLVCSLSPRLTSRCSHRNEFSGRVRLPAALRAFMVAGSFGLSHGGVYCTHRAYTGSCAYGWRPYIVVLSLVSSALERSCKLVRWHVRPTSIVTVAWLGPKFSQWTLHVVCCLL